MRDLIAWLRTIPPTGTDHPGIAWGPQSAAARAQGFENSVAEATRLTRRAPASLGPALAQGRYLARVACARCHGPDLSGPLHPRAGDPPDLRIAASYTVAQLATMFRTGLAPGGRKVGDMSIYGRERVSALTDDEIPAIHAYLVARAARR